MQSSLDERSAHLVATMDELAEARKKVDVLESTLLMCSRASQANLGGLNTWMSRAQAAEQRREITETAVQALLIELARVNQDASRTAELNGTQWLRGSNWAEVMRRAEAVRRALNGNGKSGGQ